MDRGARWATVHVSHYYNYYDIANIIYTFSTIIQSKTFSEGCNITSKNLSDVNSFASFSATMAWKQLFSVTILYSFSLLSEGSTVVSILTLTLISLLEARQRTSQNHRIE